MGGLDRTGGGEVEAKWLSRRAPSLAALQSGCAGGFNVVMGPLTMPSLPPALPVTCAQCDSAVHP